MTPVRWMIAIAVATALAAALAATPAIRAEVLLGMAAPLFAAVMTWLLVERAHRQDPLLVMPVMLKAWAAKIVWFSAYMFATLKGLELSPVPFVVSFTLYFVALHLAESVLLHRLFRRAWRTAPESRPAR